MEMEEEINFFLQGSEVGRLIQNMDWSQTDLGPISSWTEDFCMALDICLKMPLAAHLIWGPDYKLFYNDAYISYIDSRNRHPAVLGRPMWEAWPDEWDEFMAPILNEIYTTKESIKLENQIIFINRQIPNQ